MNRRVFLGLAGAGAAQVMTGCQAAPETSGPEEVKLAGMTLAELRRRYHAELFDSLLPFWDRHGIDHERGGVVCALDHDGRRANTDKQLWFQGRAIWVYSFLYNHFGQDARHLDIARKTKEFVLAHAPRPDGWWAEILAEDGKVLRPFSGDVYGMYFVAEGLQEYAAAAGDDEALDTAIALLRRLHQHIQRPDYRFMGTGAPGVRAQGLWMVTLRIVTQILNRQEDAELEKVAAQCVDAVIHKHYNPEIGLNNEMLNFDFSRPAGEATKSLPGHSIETLWMVMDEADRLNDPTLWATCAERIHRHIEVGWDYVYGGLAEWVNVDQGCYAWEVERPVGTDLEFRFVGEYQYMKALWALHEIQVATLKIFERTRAEFASRFF
ncbi:MAG: hypothetical protein GY953_25245, partial [bacterium]|nr:hypothetical protein [bacterium]